MSLNNCSCTDRISNARRLPMQIVASSFNRNCKVSSSRFRDTLSHRWIRISLKICLDCLGYQAKFACRRQMKCNLFKNILIRRCDHLSLKREEEMLQFLLNDNATICIGLPGIGKSIKTIKVVMLVSFITRVIDRVCISAMSTPIYIP